MKPILLLGEAWGSNEAAIQAGFCGASGIELLRMLADASIITLTSEDTDRIRQFYNTSDPLHIDCIWRLHPEVHRTNVFNLHPPGNDLSHLCGPKAEAVTGYPPIVKSKWLHRQYIPELERLADEICSIDPHLVVALGNTPLWALCGTTGISKIRGTTRLSTHTAEGYKVLPTYHPAAVIRQWELRPTTVMDLVKAKREAQFPEVRRPKRKIWIEPTLEDLEEFYHLHIRNCPLLSVDVENPGGPISEIGFGHKTAAIVIPFVDTRKKDRSYWRTKSEELTAISFIRRVLEDITIKKIMQNGIYDAAVIWRWWGIRMRGFEEDPMLLHHALQPEALKGLAYLGSIYTDEGAWKQMRKFKTFKRDD